MRMKLQSFEYLHEIIPFMSLAFFRYIIEFFCDDPFVIVKEFVNVVVVIIERVAVDLSLLAKIGNGNG